MNRLEQAKLVLKYATDEIERLQAALAQAEKPELQHLDWGVQSASGHRWLKIHDTIWWIGDENWDQGEIEPSTCDESWYRGECRGNLKEVFDDLKARAETLMYFKTDVHAYRIDSKQYPDAPIYMAGNHHSIVEVEEHVRNLQRLLATYKRQQNAD